MADEYEGRRFAVFSEEQKKDVFFNWYAKNIKIATKYAISVFHFLICVHGEQYQDRQTALGDHGMDRQTDISTGLYHNPWAVCIFWYCPP